MQAPSTTPMALVIAIASAPTFACAPALAQEPPTAIEVTAAEADAAPADPSPREPGGAAIAPRWTGVVSLGAAAASGTRDLDDVGARFGLALRARGEWRRDAWRAQAEVAFGSEPLVYDAASWLRQAWVARTQGAIEVRLGRQIVAWGRADRLNPTDNLSPRNLRALVPDIDEDRIGIDAVSLRVNLGERTTLTALHAPRMPATVLPDAIASIPEALGGRRVSDQSSAADTRALRIDHSGNSLDISLSVVDGPAVTPAFADAARWPGLPAAAQPGVRIIGADFSAALGDRWGLRGEFASTSFDQTPPAGLGDFRYAVLGIERHVSGGWLALAQLVHRRAERTREEPSIAAALNRAIWFQTEARSDALYLGINRAQFEGALSGNVGLLQTLDDRGRAWFANVAWRVDDRWNVLARWQHFRGPVDTNLGALRRDSLVLLELRGTWGGSR